MSAVALICGGARGVWEERAQAVELVAAAGLSVVSVGINESGMAHPDPLHHWVTLHPEKLETWERQRVQLGRSLDGVQKWSESRNRTVRGRAGITGVARTWRDGSSGLTAIDVARNHLGLPAILCGVPMDDSVNVYRGVPWREWKRYRRGFVRAMQHFREHVRSMSGWTRETLGEPTREWLESLGSQMTAHAADVAMVGTTPAHAACCKGPGE